MKSKSRKPHFQNRKYVAGSAPILIGNEKISFHRHKKKSTSGTVKEYIEIHREPRPPGFERPPLDLSSLEVIE